VPIIPNFSKEISISGSWTVLL